MRKLPIICLAILLALSFSCKDDDDNTTSSSMFNINVNLDAEAFVLITNQDKDVLFSGFDSDLDGAARFDIEPGDIVDLTYGSQRVRDFRIYTYRNITPNFQINSEIKQTGFEFSDITRRKATISDFQGTVINNIFDDLELINGGMVLSDERIGQDILLTIFDQQSNQYKSILLGENSWTAQDDGSFDATISVSDFEVSTEHIVELSQFSNDWIVNAFATVGNNARLVIDRWRNSFDDVEGTIIKLYTTPDLSFESLDLSIRDADTREGFSYNGFGLSSFPERIDFTEMEIDFIAQSPDAFEIFNDSDYDLAAVEYEYVFDNVISLWTIYQGQEETLEYELPTLPSEFLENSNIVEGVIEEPRELSANYFNLEHIDISNGFDDNVHARLSCENYTETYLKEAIQ